MKTNLEDQMGKDTEDEVAGKKQKTTKNGNAAEMDAPTKLVIAETKAKIMAEAEALIVKETRRVIEENTKELTIDHDDEEMDSSEGDPQPEVVVIVNEDRRRIRRSHQRIFTTIKTTATTRRTRWTATKQDQMTERSKTPMTTTERMKTKTIPMTQMTERKEEDRMMRNQLLPTR